MGRKKRTSGEGSVFQDARGYWNVQVPTGRRVRGRMTYKRIRAKKLADLHTKRREFEQRLARGLVVAGATPTVEMFLRGWLDQSVAVRNRIKTAAGYEQITRDYLVPHLGGHRIDDLEPRHVQTMLNDIAKERAPRTVRNVRACLRRALNVAKRDGYANRNVAELVDVPQAPTTVPRTLNADEARQLLAAVEGHRLEALYWVALCLGLREGELCGLRLVDLQLGGDAPTLTIVQAVQRQPGGLVIVQPKTDASAAPLPIPVVLAQRLRMHLARLAEEQSVEGWQEHGLLFPSERGTSLEPRNLVRHFKSLLVKAGLPDVRFHDLRHSCATLLISAGEHPRIVQAILRHASFHTTMQFYGHAMPSVQRDAAERLGTLLGEPERVIEMPAKEPARRK